MAVERLPRFNIPITNPEPEPKPDTYFIPVSPSLLENLDNPPSPEVKLEQVVSSLRGDLGHKLDNTYVNHTRRARKYENQSLDRVPLRSEQYFDKWKKAHIFVARPPKTRKKPQTEGLTFSASQVEDIWKNNPSILRLESGIGDAHKKRLVGKGRSLLSETDPNIETNDEVLKIVNANFFNEFGSQVRLRYDYLSVLSDKIVIVDQKYTSKDPYDRVQVLLYSLFAKEVAADTTILHEVSEPIPINVPVMSMEIDNVEFWYRLFDPVQNEFYYLNKTLKGSELTLAWEEFIEKAKRWEQERREILPILRLRERAFVRPHIPEGKDFLWPTQMRLL